MMAERKRAAPKRFDLVVFGEFFSDMIFYQLKSPPRFDEEVKTDSFVVSPGGRLATAAIAATRLGSVTGIVTRVGADADSLPTWNEILSEGVDATACARQKGQPTALTASVAYRSNRMMVTHDPINREIEGLLDDAAVIRKMHRARHVHLACALRRPLKWIPVIRALREDGITVSADFGWNPDLSPMQLLSIVRHCEFIFPNEHEARAITGASSALSALERLQDWVRVPVIKLGARGAMLMIEGKVYRQPALKVAILDATGAGGAFDGGFLHAFLNGSSWDDCLRAGNICGSLSASKAGGSAGLPRLAEFRERMKGMQEGVGRRRGAVGVKAVVGPKAKAKAQYGGSSLRSE